MSNFLPHADVSAISALLRKYARFEGEVPPPPVPPPATPPENNGGNNGDGGQDPAWLPGRLQRAEDAARKKLLAELGIENPDTDKQLLADARKRKADEQTAAEKADAARAKAEKERDEAKAALETERRQRIADKRDGKLKDALSTAKIKPDRVAAALKLLSVEQADALSAAIKDGGEIDDKAITKIAEDARRAYPEWFGTGGPGSPSNSGGRAVDPNDKDRQSAARATTNLLRGRL